MYRMNDEPDKITCAACGYTPNKEKQNMKPFYPVHGNVMAYRDGEWVSYALYICPKCGTVRAEISE